MQSDVDMIEENTKLSQIIEKLTALKNKKLKTIKKSEAQLTILKQQHKDLENQLIHNNKSKPAEKSTANSILRENRNQSMNAIEYDVSYLNPQISHNDNILYDYSKITYNAPKVSGIIDNHAEADSKEDYYDYNGYLRKFYKKKEYVKHKDNNKTQPKKNGQETRTVISNIKNNVQVRVRK